MEMPTALVSRLTVQATGSTSRMPTVVSVQASPVLTVNGNENQRRLTLPLSVAFPIGLVHDSSYDGYTRPEAIPAPTGPPAPADITITFADINLFGSVKVYDIWAQSELGNSCRFIYCQAIQYFVVPLAEL